MKKTTIKKYYLEVFGCQMNLSDSERIAALLEKLNYERVAEEQSADLIVVVACSIRQSAVDRVYGRAQRWRAMKKKRPLVTALSGCVLKSDQAKLTSVFDLFFDAHDLNSLPSQLGNRFRSQGGDTALESDWSKIKPLYRSDFQAYVAISTGCNNFCTYCVVPYTRGRERSRPAEDIKTEVEELLKRGYKEITLLGQNVNSYGLDGRPPRHLDLARGGDGRLAKNEVVFGFPNLLRQVARLPYAYWLRFLSPNPQDFSDELIEVVAAEPNCTKWVHLPIQSGDNEVLKRMNRRYTVEHFLNLVDRIRERIPGVSITTDVIVGFCGETEAQFENTLKVFEAVKFDMAYTAQYSHRTGTGAYRAFNDDVPDDVKEDRERRLTEVLKAGALARNQALVGQTVTVLVDTHKKGFGFGKNEGNKTIRFASDKNLVSQFVNIKITHAQAWGLNGELVDANVTARGKI